MPKETAQNRMLSQALSLLARAEELHRVTFGLGPVPAWEPPLDLIETDSEVLAYVALPGVDMSSVEISAESGFLVLRGYRQRPPEWRTAGFLRLELPNGPFERKVRIPDGHYQVSSREGQGCLIIRMRKLRSSCDD